MKSPTRSSKPLSPPKAPKKKQRKKTTTKRTQSPTLRVYLTLERKMMGMKDTDPRLDALMDIMDRAWFALTDQERSALDSRDPLPRKAPPDKTVHPVTENAYSIDLKVTRNSTKETFTHHQDIPAYQDFYREDLPAIQHALIHAVADFYQNGDTAIPARPGSSHDDGIRVRPRSKKDVEACSRKAVIKETERIRKAILTERAKHVPVAPTSMPKEKVMLAVRYLTKHLEATGTFNLERMRNQLDKILTPEVSIPGARPIPTPSEACAHAKRMKAKDEAEPVP